MRPHRASLSAGMLSQEMVIVNLLITQNDMEYSQYLQETLEDIWV